MLLLVCNGYLLIFLLTIRRRIYISPTLLLRTPCVLYTYGAVVYGPPKSPYTEAHQIRREKHGGLYTEHYSTTDEASIFIAYSKVNMCTC